MTLIRLDPPALSVARRLFSEEPQTRQGSPEEERTCSPAIPAEREQRVPPHQVVHYPAPRGTLKEHSWVLELAARLDGGSMEWREMRSEKRWTAIWTWAGKAAGRRTGSPPAMSAQAYREWMIGQKQTT
ncbi:hypothetical protein NDU88_007049 [Pleurodeles waltl]|uniref:Uncharacterized protein n=1 Tax=Pleurodeles waltl TaxID=8319 RepID=A0AAV7PP49_PLEWA|nr:hypothetical protein NDU88_007049 [Pleurodeles waltl]